MDGNDPLTRPIEKFLNKQLETQIKKDINQYATDADGHVDEKLAQRIRWEVGRRGETGKQLDIYEPLRWTGIRTGLGIIGAGVAKAISDRASGKSKQLFFTIEIAAIVTTAINSLIDLTRIYPRWLAGLEGGKNTALKLNREFGAFENESITPDSQLENGKSSIPKQNTFASIERKSLLEYAESSKQSISSRA